MLISAGSCLTLADPNQPGRGTVDKPLTSLPTVLAEPLQQGRGAVSPHRRVGALCFGGGYGRVFPFGNLVFFTLFFFFLGGVIFSAVMQAKNDEFRKAKLKVSWRGGGGRREGCGGCSRARRQQRMKHC